MQKTSKELLEQVFYVPHILSIPDLEPSRFVGQVQVLEEEQVCN